VKKRLEQSLFLVKGLMQASGVVESVQVGNLKHKDLAGRVVMSQAYVDSSSDESEGEGEEDEAAEAAAAAAAEDTQEEEEDARESDKEEDV